MIDIHTHVLPETDDGAVDIEHARAMLRLAAASGTTDIVATPHANLRYRFDAARVRQRHAELSAAADPGMPRLHLGCELHLTYDNVLACLHAPQDYTIAGGSWLLLELGDDNLLDASIEIIGSLVNAGLRPIIAHPERTDRLRLRPDLLRALEELGCTFQVTAGSLTGRFGKRAQAAADALLKTRMVHFLASDAHDDLSRQPVLSEAFERIRGVWGADRANALCRDNPLAVLENRDLPIQTAPTATPSRLRRWFHFARSAETNA